MNDVKILWKCAVPVIGGLMGATYLDAGVTLQPVSVIAYAPMGQFDNASFSATNLINQSGLVVGYTSGITDFASYIASNPIDNKSPGYWASTAGNTTGILEFDLGSLAMIQSFALWNNGGGSNHNIIGFDLVGDADGDFNTGSVSLLIGQNANPNTGAFLETLPEVFTFAPTEVRYVRMIISSNNGNTTFTQAAEVMFEQVPEPTVASLTLASMVFLLRRCRR
ncbi:MAG: discoidin domain-containing protein [Luteolibacter sp.]